jgi:hypothetical protein
MIYCIQDDGFDFQRLDLMLDDVIEAKPVDVSEDDVLDFCQTNCRLASWWPNPDALFISQSDGEADSIPDISKWIDASLVLSPKAHRLLGATLEQWGDLLPVMVKGERYYIFNCQTTGEVDLSLSVKEYFEGEEIGVKKIVFNASDTSEKLLFKTPFNSCIEIYCGERFKSLVEEFSLTGIQFVPV